MFEKIDAETKTFFFKIIIPALVAVSIKLAIASQTTKMSAFNVIGSFVIGVGIAYLCGDLVLSTVDHNYVPLVIGIMTLVGEKLSYFILYKLKVDELAVSFFEYVISIIKK